MIHVSSSNVSTIGNNFAKLTVEFNNESGRILCAIENLFHKEYKVNVYINIDNNTISDICLEFPYIKKDYHPILEEGIKNIYRKCLAMDDFIPLGGLKFYDEEKVFVCLIETNINSTASVFLNELIKFIEGGYKSWSKT